MRQLLPTAVADVDPEVVYGSPDRRRQDGRPWVMANMVASVDGSAAVEGRTAPLSGPGDRAVFRLLRSLADVVLVGAGTARAERYGPVRRAHPCPVAVVSRSLDLDWDAPLFTEAVAPTLVITCEAADPARRARAEGTAEVVVAGHSQVDLALALADLERRGHRLVLCEGGPLLLSEMVAADLLDELCFTLSPLLVGGTTLRLLTGPAPHEPRSLILASALEDQDSLLLRYLRR